MATVMERGEETSVTTAATEATTPARLTTTLYDLMTMLQDVAGPEGDTLVVATMVHLLRSRRCTWRRVTPQVAPLPTAFSDIPGVVIRNNGLVVRNEEDRDAQGESPW
jgi:hypothetical protein